MLKIIEKTKIWFTISGIIITIGIVSLFINGLNFGIDFKGGTIVQMDLKESFNKENLETDIIKKYAPDAVSNKVESTSIEIKSDKLTDEKITSMVKEIKAKYKNATVSKQDRIGASIGNELKKKALYALIVANIAMLAYVAIRFELKFAVAAILSLVHDVLIMLAVYSVFKIPVNAGFVAAMLTVVGYSINDTIVVFDRIRENGKYMKRNEYMALADASVTQTMSRSINTVLTVLITITCVCIFVPAIRDFSIPLLVGITSGCYSSIFIASPFWVIFKNMEVKKKLTAKNA